MNPCNEARADPGMELAPQAFPRAEPPRAVFSSPGSSSRQESQYGTAPNTTTNAVMPLWTSISSSVGSFRSASAVGKDIGTEQVQDELRRFRYSEFSSQQKTTNYMRGASGFTNIFPAINEKSCSGQKSFYPCRGFVNGDENSETKLYDVGSTTSWNPESLGLIQEPASVPQTASSFYYDTGVKSGIEATSFLPQGSLIQTAVTNPVSMDNVDLLQGMEATEDNEAHILMCPEDRSLIPRSDDNSCPNHKGKIVRDCLSDSNWTAEHHHLKDYHIEGNKSCVQNVSESAVIPTNLLRLFCPEYTVAGCHHVVSYPYPCFDVKELEEIEWTKLLQKELTNSDVGSLGRIVLPKKEAEANLPPLLEKDGLFLEMVDMANHVVWGFKYRFWPNNRSRMYVLENTGDFAKMNKLEIGDSLVIYGDGASRYYLVGVEKKVTREKI